MKFWAIIKLIAGIISNLPFSEQTTEAEITAAVTQAVEAVQDEPGILADASIPKSDWEELAAILTSLFLWGLRVFGK